MTDKPTDNQLEDNLDSPWQNMRNEYVYLVLDNDTILRIHPCVDKLYKCKVELTWHAQKYNIFTEYAYINRQSIAYALRKIHTKLQKAKRKQKLPPVTTQNIADIQTILKIVK